MNSSNQNRFSTPFILGLAFAITTLCALPSAQARDRSAPYTAVYSQVSRDYQRNLAPDGTWMPETYAFGKGFCLNHTQDKSVEAMEFRGMGAVLSLALAEEGYLPTPSPEETKLLILVHWGKTAPFDDGNHSANLQSLASAMAANAINQSQAAERQMSQISGPGAASRFDEGLFRSLAGARDGEINQMLALQGIFDADRDRANVYNARLLGYHHELNRTDSAASTFGPLRHYRTDLKSDLEAARYFVILEAYDFQKAWKEKKRELLWVSRFSIRAKGRQFDEELFDMAVAASRYFGNKSGTFVRDATPGKVIIGELEMLGQVTD